MKRIILVLMAAGMLTACHHGNSSNVAAAATDPNAPVISFEEQSFNFGKIKQGDSVMHIFKFTNTGKTPLVINNAIASCGCTIPEWPKQPIAPNGSGEIKATFHSAGKQGLIDKMITVSANTTPPQNMVHLVGEVTVTK